MVSVNPCLLLTLGCLHSPARTKVLVRFVMTSFAGADRLLTPVMNSSLRRPVDGDLHDPGLPFVTQCRLSPSPCGFLSPYVSPRHLSFLPIAHNSFAFNCSIYASAQKENPGQVLEGKHSSAVDKSILSGAVCENHHPGTFCFDEDDDCDRTVCNAVLKRCDVCSGR